MSAIYNAEALRDLKKMDPVKAGVFVKHVQKISGMPQRRHLKFGLPFLVDEVGGGRLIYTYEGDDIRVVRCFSNHHDYEKWYKAYR